MKQSKKIFTRMLLNNWGGISHEILEFHEYVNLFSGKSGSGKSTVMDALQVVLYGSLASVFLNKAADDAKNRRSVLSYLRGEQKDGTANREGQDFCSQLVLEIKDTGKGIHTCVGVTFEVGRNDQDIKSYSFFSHSGKLPEHCYFTEDKIAFSIGQMRNFVKDRIEARDNRGRGDVNRLYPSNESYMNTLYDVILGYIDGKRFKTMEKSAIALKMTNGTGQFIRDYMFPKSKGDTIEKISEQLGAYREIKERIDDLEHRIELLNDVRTKHIELQNTKADMIKTEKILKFVDIDSVKMKMQAFESELEELQEQLKKAEEENAQLEAEKAKKTEQLIEVESNLKSSDYGKKQQELKEVKKTLELHSKNSREWRRIVQALCLWEEDETVTDYVSNPALQIIDKFRKGRVTEEDCVKLKRHLADAGEEIDQHLRELDAERRKISAELKEKEEMVADLKADKKPYQRHIKEARYRLERELSDRFGRRVPVYVFADLFDISDDEWADAIEGRLGQIKKNLITAPEYAHEAAVQFRKMKGYESVHLIHSDAIYKDQPKAEAGSLYEAVQAEEEYVDAALRRYLGRVRKCRSVEELEQVRDGVTPDCYAYSNYIFRHLRKEDYDKYACIGTKVSKAKLAQLEDEVAQLKEKQSDILLEYGGLNRYHGFEQLKQEPDMLVSLSKAAGQLEKYLKKKENLEKELQELEEGGLIARLNKQKEEIKRELDTLDAKMSKTGDQIRDLIHAGNRAEINLSQSKEKLEELMQGYVANPDLEAEVREALKVQREAAYRTAKQNELERLREKEERCKEERFLARNAFNGEYPSLNFTGMERDNQGYDQLLERYQDDFEPKYKAEFEDKYNEVYISLRENVIATIHGEIKAAYRHRREINRMLGSIQFSDSVYQIDILPAENENGQFYEMLMAKELDSKVTDHYGFEGQLSLGEDEFLQKYEQKIKLLTEKFMPVKDGDNQQIALKKQEMEKYADYRNYLTFSMYERVIDEQGNEKKNLVDEMAGRDSGGEGQNPKYVALLAGFAMLYMQQSNRDSKIRLVLLDEAFSKMDKERSEVCLRYARELELQLIVCVPDERLQSLIRYVDCVYGFRRHQNQISMMHIDKGSYLKMLEGDSEDEREETRQDYAGEVAD